MQAMDVLRAFLLRKLRLGPREMEAFANRRVERGLSRRHVSWFGPGAEGPPAETRSDQRHALHSPPLNSSGLELDLQPGELGVGS